MKNLMFAATQFVLLALIGVSVDAQVTKEKDNKPQTTTVDAWRQALPQSEQLENASPVVEERSTKVSNKESAEQIEKRIIDLEQSLFESVRLRDSAKLDVLISDDFMLAGLNLPGDKPDKDRFVNWVLKELQIKSYSVEKALVRVLPSTAVVTINYKRQASVSGAESDGDFTVTNVWAKRGQVWQIVSHHVSRPSKP